jgi:hypothetical protein
MLDEAAHPRPRDSTSTEDLHSVTRRFLRRLRSIHFQQGNRSGKVLRLLLVRLYPFLLSTQRESVRSKVDAPCCSFDA